MRVEATLAIVLSCLAGSAYAQGVSQCDKALTEDTYKVHHETEIDWRLALSVSEAQWNTAKHDASANGELYNIPLGAKYSDYTNNVRQYASDRQESLHFTDALDFVRTYLDPGARQNYAACLRATVLMQPGVQATVVDLTPQEAIVEVAYHAGPDSPHNIPIKFGGDTNLLSEVPPPSLTNGARTPITVRRPTSNDEVITLKNVRTGDGTSVRIPHVIQPEFVKRTVDETWNGQGSYIQHTVPSDLQGRFVKFHVTVRAALQGATTSLSGYLQVDRDRRCGTAAPVIIGDGHSSIGGNSFDCTIYISKQAANTKIGMEYGNLGQGLSVVANVHAY